METANVQKMFNGPESFTPDGNWIVGESPEVQTFYLDTQTLDIGLLRNSMVYNRVKFINVKFPSQDLNDIPKLDQ